MNRFKNASKFNQNIGPWDVGNVVSMNNMFKEATDFNNGGSSDISNWDTTNVQYMVAMFDLIH